MFKTARNPKWESASHGAIMLEVEQLISTAVNQEDGGLTKKTEWVNFVARPTDCTEYGPGLFRAAIAGRFGEIADSDEEQIITGRMPPPEGHEVRGGVLVNVAEYERRAQMELNNRLAEFLGEEAMARAELDDAYAAERKAKMIALLAVKGQAGWPVEVDWPE